MGDRLQQALKH